MDNVLVLSPHTDDGELGCGGLLSRFGGRIVVFSYCNDGKLLQEFRASCNILGVIGNFYNSFKLRNFYKDRQEILDEMIVLNKEHHPKTVICPSLNDIHQDHRVIAEEALRAFKNCNLISYELPWNNLNFDAEMFVTLDDENILEKINALGCYKSQSNRPYMDDNYIGGQARYHGVRCGAKWAEAYEVVRWII